MNPLLQDFNTAPFSQIKESDYIPAIKTSNRRNERRKSLQLFQILSAPTFENTTVALDFTGEKLNRITSIFFNLNSAETTDGIQQIAKEISPWLSEFRNDMILNEALFH